MVDTYIKGSPKVEVSDSTVTVLEGGVRLGNKFVPFTGGQISFSSMISYSNDSSKYQNSLLYLSPIGLAVDMTKAVSALATSRSALTLPILPDSTAYPLGMFTFYSSDGTTADLLSYVTI